MLRPTLTRWHCLALVLSCSLLSLTSGSVVKSQVPASSGATAEGIKLYEEGNFSEAVKILDRVVKKTPADADAWYYLGLSYYKSGYIGASGVAFERLLKLRPNSADATAKLSHALILVNDPDQAMIVAKRALELGDQSAEPHYAIAEASLRTQDYPLALQEAETALKIDPRFFEAYITRSMAHFNAHSYKDAVADLEQLLALNPEDPDADIWKSQIAQLRRLSSMGYGPPAATPPDPEMPMRRIDLTVKARVLKKIEPRYTEIARHNQVQGTILLRCIFGSKGEVRDCVVLRSLGFGLNAAAVKAAQQIEFKPAEKDGKAVSMYMHLEYNFNLY
jgi:TonB family protein